MDEPSTQTESTAAPGLPLPGYKPQSQANLDLVTEGKYIEERLLRYIDKVFAACSQPGSGMDARFAAAGRTQIQFGCMGVYRAIMNPKRAVLPEDQVELKDAPPAPEAPPSEPAPEPPKDAA